MRNPLQKLFVYAALLLGAAVFIIPLLWMLSTAVKPVDQAMSSPPRWLPYSWVYNDNGNEITVGLDGDAPDDGMVSVQVAYRWLIEIDGERVPVAPVGNVASGGMTQVVVHYHTKVQVEGAWRPAQLADPDWAPAADDSQTVELVFLDDEGYTIRHTAALGDVMRVYDQTKEDLVGSFAESQTLTVPGEALIKTIIPWDDRAELAHAQTERREVERAALSRYIDFRWENFGKAIRAMKHFPSYLKNTIILCVLTVIGTVCSSTLVAYGFARIEWPGRDKVFLVVLATMMVPFPVVMVPLFTMFKNFGWIGTLKPLWVPTFFAGAFNIFLLRQFFRTIPKDLSESARIDGCSELRIFWQIILPLARPAIAVVALFQFMGTWNDFLGPLIYLTEQKDFTLALGLQAYQSQSGGTQWHYLMAASSLVVLPVIVLFFLAQRTFIEGISMTGLKG